LGLGAILSNAGLQRLGLAFHAREGPHMSLSGSPALSVDLDDFGRCFPLIADFFKNEFEIMKITCTRTYNELAKRHEIRSID
jgi:hypothetical protein